MVARQHTRPRPYWHQMEIESLGDVVRYVAAEGLDRLVLSPSYPDQDRIDRELKAHVDQGTRIALDDYITNLAVEAGDVGVLLGFGLGLTRAEAIDQALSFEDWLARAVVRVGLDTYTSTTHYRPAGS